MDGWRTSMVAVVLSLGYGASAGAQEAAIFRLLEGRWSGEGDLLGRPATFTMRWELRTGDVAVLTFANAFGDSEGPVTPALEATAVYRTSSDVADAHWTDSRGTLIGIRWEATDSTLTAHWEAPTERGRTEYRVVPSGLEVVDRVRSGTEWRVFARARYGRVAEPLAPADPALGQVAWLAGCWRREQAEIRQEERWTPPAGDAMLGVSRTVEDGRLVAHEYLQIRMTAGRPTYVALPSGQAETAFTLVAADDSSVVFENPEHDFPQRVGYTRHQGGRMTAWIEGSNGGEVRRIPFAFVRGECGEAPAR